MRAAGESRSFRSHTSDKSQGHVTRRAGRQEGAPHSGGNSAESKGLGPGDRATFNASQSGLPGQQDQQHGERGKFSGVTPGLSHPTPGHLGPHVRRGGASKSPGD